MIIVSRSPEETARAARNLTKKIKKAGSRHATVIALEGELGAGKTIFIKELAKVLGIKAHITSPTFVILKSYKLKTKRYGLLVHIDAYRLNDYKDLLPLGIKDMLAKSENIIVIEWSERVKPILPKKCIKIHIDHIDSKTRKINIQNPL